MSGGISQLVAIGAQDAHLVGNPTVSFFKSKYSRHTNFSHVVQRQVIQGNPASNGMSTVRFERKGDLVSYVYLTVKNSTGVAQAVANRMVDKVELLIGGQVIDTQDFTFSSNIAPFTTSSTTSKANIAGVDTFYPLRFWFCENVQSSIPLVALQYHDVELRITWGSSFTEGDTAECWADFIYLDTAERQQLSVAPQNMLIYQVQKAVASQSKIQELNFNHPIKFLATSNTMTAAPTTDKIRMQINGVDIGEDKTITPHFNSVTCFYHTSLCNRGNDTNTINLIPFCLDTNKLQPTGSLNFSRLDSARIVTDASTGFDQQSIYGVNYNILRIENGMGGLMYAN